MSTKIQTKASKPLSINEDERSIQVVMTTADVDRDNDIVVTTGIDTKNFEENPVVLWAHDPSQPPIGTVTEMEKHENMLLGTVKFADTERGNEIFKLYKDGIMRTWSIGFSGKSVDYRKNADGDVVGYKFTQSELFELSAVPVPANPGALVRACKGIKDDTLRKDLEALLPKEEKKEGVIEIGKEVSVLIKDEDILTKTVDLKIGEGAFHKSNAEAGANGKIEVCVDKSVEGGDHSASVHFEVIKEVDGTVTELKIKKIEIHLPSESKSAPLTPKEPSRTVEEEEAENKLLAEKASAKADLSKAMAEMRESIVKSQVVEL